MHRYTVEYVKAATRRGRESRTLYLVHLGSGLYKLSADKSTSTVFTTLLDVEKAHLAYNNLTIENPQWQRKVNIIRD